MDSQNFNSREYEILVHAPTGQDAKLLSEALRSASFISTSLKSVEELNDESFNRCGCLVIAEEALNPASIVQLNQHFENQETWSDVPVIMMTLRRPIDSNLKILNTFSKKGNIVLLERPFHPSTLVQMVGVSLRARKRQYRMRDLLENQIDATRMRDEFISIAGHELKTPLTGMKLQAQINKRVLQKAGPGALPFEKIQKWIESSEKQVDKLSRLTEDMLDMARMNTRKLTMEKSTVDLSDLVGEAVENLAGQMAQANCKLDFASQPGIFLNADPYRLDQVVTNLLTNVLRYAPGKPVHVSVWKEEGCGVITVRDEGPGLAPGAESRIFERFERAVTSRNISGLGLGLYICKEIVEALKGKISVSSQPGEGATFRVELPLPSSP